MPKTKLEELLERVERDCSDWREELAPVHVRQRMQLAAIVRIQAEALEQVKRGEVDQDFLNMDAQPAGPRDMYWSEFVECAEQALDRAEQLASGDTWTAPETGYYSIGGGEPKLIKKGERDEA